jgi:hypothetical protein
MLVEYPTSADDLIIGLLPPFPAKLGHLDLGFGKGEARAYM